MADVQEIIDETVADIDEIVRSAPLRPGTYAWWRGHLSGVVRVVETLDPGADTAPLEAAFRRLCEAEAAANVR